MRICCRSMATRARRGCTLSRSSFASVSSRRNLARRFLRSAARAPSDPPLEAGADPAFGAEELLAVGTAGPAGGEDRAARVDGGSWDRSGGSAMVTHLCVRLRTVHEHVFPRTHV
jgi:hypothetical protein